MNVSESLGSRIARLRLSQGLTQESLARALGVSAQAVSKWENDQNCPDISLLVPLAELLHCSVDTLLRGEAAAALAAGPAQEGTAESGRPTTLHIDAEEGATGEVAHLSIPLAFTKNLQNLSVLPTGTVKPNETQIVFDHLQDFTEPGTLIDVDDGQNHVHIWLD